LFELIYAERYVEGAKKQKIILREVKGRRINKEPGSRHTLQTRCRKLRSFLIGQKVGGFHDGIRFKIMLLMMKRNYNENLSRKEIG
jgi:hypothetical protein